MNFKWRPRHLVRLFFLHTRYLHCLIYIEKSKSESVFLVNQIVLYLITHWFTQYRYICYWFVNVLPNPQIQQRSMAERNRMFIKFNFVNVYRFCSKQTRSWFIKPYSKKVRPIVWFFIHKRTPPPPSFRPLTVDNHMSQKKLITSSGSVQSKPIMIYVWMLIYLLSFYIYLQSKVPVFVLC